NFFYQGNTHLPMEQYCAVGFYGPDDKLTVWSSTQTPHYLHRALAKVLKLPASRIRVVATPVGGGFGGKSDPFSHEIAVAKLSMITRRPVKITLTREESFYVHRGRHPVKMFAKTGVKSDGTIQAMQYKTYLDGGGYSSYGLATVYYTGALQTVTYKVPAYKFEGVRVFTNKPACGPKRGHGTPQPRFALEIQLDEIAEKLGIDPIDLRLKQLVEPTRRPSTVCGSAPPGCTNASSGWPTGPNGRKNSASFLLVTVSGSQPAPISAARAYRFTGTTCRTRACRSKSTAAAASL